MAAEHESKRARCRGAQPAALPRAGDDARLRPDPRRRLRASVADPPHASVHLLCTEGFPNAQDRRSQQGLARRRLRGDAARGRLPAAPRPARPGDDRPANGVEFFYLRPRDIAVYVGEGTLDIGLTGRDLVLDSRAPVTERLSLGFGGSQFYFAAPADGITTVEELEGRRVATSYAGLLEDFFSERDIDGACRTPRRRSRDGGPARRGRRDRRCGRDRLHAQAGGAGDVRRSDPRRRRRCS